MSSINGIVLREVRNDFVEDEIHKCIAIQKAELLQRREEHASVKAQKAEAKVKNEVQSAEQKLHHMADDALQRVERYRLEFDAKLDALQIQASHATPGARAQIEARITEMRTDEQQRLQKLQQAWNLTQQALGA